MKSLIVLIIDHDTYTSEESGEQFTEERLLEQAKIVNADASTILGYEAWMAVFEAPHEIIQDLADNNMPLPDGFDINR